MRNRKRAQSRACPAQGQAVDGQTVASASAVNRSWFELLLQALSGHRDDEAESQLDEMENDQPTPRQPSPLTLPAGIADDQPAKSWTAEEHRAHLKAITSVVAAWGTVADDSPLIESKLSELAKTNELIATYRAAEGVGMVCLRYLPSPAADRPCSSTSPAATAMLDDDLIELYCGMPPKDMSHADLRIHLQVLDMIQEAEMVLAFHSSRTVPKERFRSRIVSVYHLAARYLGIDSQTEMQLSAALLVWIGRTERQAVWASQQQAVARC